MSTILAHLAGQLGPSTENVAAEALSYILSKSPEARRAMLGIAQSFGLQCTDALSFQTQVSDENGGRPDLVGRAPDETNRLLIEAKFWAGLTGNQPVTYLRSSLHPARPGCLLFVMPAARLETVWPELLRRVRNEGLMSGERHEGLRSVTCGQHILSATSWRAVLEALLDSVRASGDASVAEDIRQLMALCEQMDTTAFLPLHSEELNPRLGRRNLEFCALTDDLTAKLVHDGLASTKNTRATPVAAGYMRYALVKEHGAAIQFNCDYWMTWGDSPLWFAVAIPGHFMATPSALNAHTGPALRRAGIEFKIKNGTCLVPLYLPLRKERDEVLEVAYRQLKAAAEALPAGGNEGAA
jgi:hypothetical protein